jgi:RHS repeat-associated protein
MNNRKLIKRGSKMDFTFMLSGAGYFNNSLCRCRLKNRVLSIVAFLIATCSVGVFAGVQVEPNVSPWKYTICRDTNWQHAAEWRKECERWDVGTWHVDSKLRTSCINKNDPRPWDDEGVLLDKAAAYSGPPASWTTNWLNKGGVFYSFCWDHDADDEVTSPRYSLGVEIRNFRKVMSNGSHYVTRRDRTAGCPAESTVQGGQCILPEPPANQDIGCDDDNDSQVGNPCDAATGNKYESDTDVSIAGIKLTRSYNSQNPQDSGFGKGWSSNVQRRLSVAGSSILSYRSDGKSEPWVKAGSNWSSDGDETLMLSEDANGFTLTRANGTNEYYSLTGQLVSITDTNGLATQYHYGTNDKVTSIIGPWGHTLSLTYNHDDLINTATDSLGYTWVYGYDTNRNLVSVTYPDFDPQDLSNNPIKTYHYENINFPNHLTGITDERGDRYATFTYNSSGLAIGTEHGITTNGVPQEAYSLHYDSSTQTTVTDAAGTVQIMSFTEQLGRKKLTQSQHVADGLSINKSYDSNNNLLSRIDEEGRLTQYTYNAYNQKTSTIEAVGTPEQRTTIYAYYSNAIDLITNVIRESVSAGDHFETTTVYDTHLNPVSVTQTGFQPDESVISRSTSMTYDSAGRVLSIDGSRTDTADITTLTYYTCATGAECGQLASVTNAAGHTTTYDMYDANGRPLQITDSNGTVSTSVYDYRGRLISSTLTPLIGIPRTTLYAFDDANQLESVTYADGVTALYHYDAAHDLISVTDNIGNRVEYLYDSRGNKIEDLTKNSDGTLVNKMERVFDIRNRIAATHMGGGNGEVASVSHQLHDAIGKLIERTDPNQNPPTTYEYDGHDRLTQTIDALFNPTVYEYNIHDNLVQVGAPNGASTEYVYDDLGNLLSESSPDRGLITYTHDVAGNVIGMVDARGVSVVYRYDALNRLLSVDYPGTDEDQSFRYDSCIQGVGRLCVINDESGLLEFEYDAYGNRLVESRTQDNATYRTEYSFDAGNRVTSMTYPNGRVVSYQRDSIGRISSVDSMLGNAAQAVVHSRAYRADRLLIRQTFGNGLNESRDYDTQGRLINHVIGGHEARSFIYDANGNVTAIFNAQKPTEYEYDSLNRLTGESSIVAGIGNDSPTHPLTLWMYDENSNRINRTMGNLLNDTPDCDPDVDESCSLVCSPGDWCFADGQKSKAYIYAPQSNQLTRVGNKSVVKDAAGNTLSDKNAKRTFNYDSAGRLFQFYKNGILKAEYTYNSQNQRVKKSLYKLDHLGDPIVHTFQFFYDQQGQLISEYKNGKPIRDYLWADNQPIQRDQIKLKSNGDVIIKNSLSLVTDHLHTPRLAMDETNTIVWRWDSNAFGKGGVEKDPDADGSKHNIRLRFPGQYADTESGLYYNWNRYYDPIMGRYITSDPIGLSGGINTYGYALQNPLLYSDYSGLVAVPVFPIILTGGSIAFIHISLQQQWEDLFPGINFPPELNPIIDPWNDTSEGMDDSKCISDGKDPHDCGNVYRSNFYSCMNYSTLNANDRTTICTLKAAYAAALCVYANWEKGGGDGPSDSGRPPGYYPVR